MNILGIHFGHDAGATILRNGEIVAAINEERLSRTKNHTGFPALSIPYVMDKARMSHGMIDRIAIPRNLATQRSLLTLASLRGKPVVEGGLRDWYAALTPPNIHKNLFAPLRLTAAADRIATRFLVERFFRSKGFEKARIMDMGHHFSHAASAYYAGPWNEALVFTLDGAGDASCGGFFHGRGGDLEPVHMIPMAGSIGEFYSIVTQFLGFIPMRHEGKVLGLAARGDVDRYIDDFERLVGLAPGNLSFKVTTNGLDEREYDWRCLSGRGPLDAHRLLWMKHLKANYGDAHRDDMAAAVQELTERHIMRMLETFLSKHPQFQGLPICLAGGVFANVRVNQLIGKLVGNDRFYVQPNMGDGGLALGAALGAQSRGEGLQPNYLQDVYMGPSYSNDEVKAELERTDGVRYTFIEDIDAKVGEALAEDKIVCRFQGGMEFGPRALGNRSILTDAKDPDINDRLNHMLQRSEFMPFAPSIMAEHFHDYFDVPEEGRYADQFMTVTYGTKPICRDKAPAVVHVDGTARPQVVHRDVSPRYHAVIDAYRECTGKPIIVNTSFNIHEEPIVCTAENGIRSFKTCRADALAIENWWVELEDR